MTVRYEASGYVKDDDAREWNADELLKSYREGTEASNEERVKLGGAGHRDHRLGREAGLRRRRAPPGVGHVVARQGRQRRRPQA